jgi:hypothetical protein
MNLIVRTLNTDNELYNSLSKSLCLKDLSITSKNSLKSLNGGDVCVCQSDVITLGVNFSENFHAEVNQMVKTIHNNFVDLEQTS